MTYGPPAHGQGGTEKKCILFAIQYRLELLPVLFQELRVTLLFRYVFIDKADHECFGDVAKSMTLYYCSYPEFYPRSRQRESVLLAYGVRYRTCRVMLTALTFSAEIIMAIILITKKQLRTQLVSN